MSETPPNMQFAISPVSGLSAVNRRQWQRLNIAGNPFLHYDFLNGLERFKCLDGHGWEPCHLIATAGKKLLGALPLYIKDNSHGEFVFDWAWADAFERAGGQYYPKLVSAIPFTPVCGPRLLINPDLDNANEVKQRLIQAAIALAEQARLSSFHCLFTAAEERAPLEKSGMLLRQTCQFHWRNRGYRDFDDFLSGMTSKRRKQIKRERKKVRENGIEILRLRGAEISEEQWAVFYGFYCSTFHKRWGSPRLTLDFFLHLSDALPDNTLLILARQNKEYIAGAFAMLSRAALHGRHWGCGRYSDNLHFELCYYQTIEHCLEHQLESVDAGVQGEHKINRGFDPMATVSGHWIRHKGFRAAVGRHLEQETAAMDAYLAHLRAHSPYKQVAP